MQVFERAVSVCAGTFCVGDGISIADINLVSMVQTTHRLNLSLDRISPSPGKSRVFPTVYRTVRACEEIPAFNEAGIPKRYWVGTGKYFARIRDKYPKPDRTKKCHSSGVEGE